MTSELADNRTYSNVINSDNSLQYTLSAIANIIATPVNLFAFYLILTQSKRETLVFKVGLLSQQVFFFISMLIWGGFAGFVFVHPFPAMYCIGPLKDLIDCFSLFLIWMISFEAYFFGYVITHLVRLRLMCRPGKIFDFKNRTYYIIIGFLVLYCFVPMNFVVLSDYATHEEMVKYVSRHYPNNMKIFENPGVYVQIHPTTVKLFIRVMMFYIISGVPTATFFLSVITYEIRKQPHMEGSKTFTARKSLLNQLTIQSLGVSIFIVLACSLMFATVFNPPEVDARLQKAIGSCFLCGASIPAQLFLIYRNSAYRNYVLKIVRRPSVFPNEDRVSHHAHRSSLKSLTEIEVRPTLAYM